VIIRDCEAKDFPALRAVHSRMKHQFELPDLSKSALSKVLCDDGQVVMAGLLRPTTEAYLICDPAWRSPRWRLEALGVLIASIAQEAKQKRIPDAHVWCENKRFGDRLMQLGWEKPLWTDYVYRTGV